MMIHRFALLFAIVVWPLAANANEPPNIVLIMTDDMGYGDLGVTGNPVIRTPNVDAMSKRSASMSTFYVSPVCAPTRASLMTGRYNYRTHGDTAVPCTGWPRSYLPSNARSNSSAHRACHKFRRPRGH